MTDTIFQKTSKGYVFAVPPTVVIYAAAERTRQEQYLATLNAIRRDMGIKQLRVEFYEHENWIEWKSEKTGAYGGKRGPERLIREEILARVAATPVS